MQENQVTVDGESYPLPRPFMVMATQNPIEYEGTYPLPEAQLDRFTLRLSLGYPTLQEESRMLTEQTSAPPLDDLEPVAGAAEALGLVEAAKAVYVEESLNRYVIALLRATRSDSRLYLGASPRSGIALLRVAKGRALAEGRDYLSPDDVKSVAAAVLSHRLILAPETRAAALAIDERIGGLGDRRTVLARHGRRAAARYVLHALPRGRYPVEQSAAVVEDPFGFARSETPLEPGSALLVYPRLVEVDALFSEVGRLNRGGRPLLLRRPTGYDLHSVREYVEGDSLRAVHWPSTAHRGQLMVKELEEAPR